MTGRQTRLGWRERLGLSGSRPSSVVEPAGTPGQPAGFVMPEGVRVVVLGREGCHLCQQAIEVVEQQCAPGQWVVVDVDQHPQLRERWTDHVPVTFVNGQLVAYWTLDPDLLADALAGREFLRPPIP